MKTADKIRKRALWLFSQNGYAGTSVDAIARQAGIKKSTLYSHIKGKDDLFFSLFEEALAWDLAYFRDLLAEHRADGAEQKLYWMFKHDYDIYSDGDGGDNVKMKFVHTAMLFPPAGLKAQMVAVFAAYEARFSAMVLEIVREGVAQGEIAERDPDELMAYYYSIVDGLFLGAYYYEKDVYRKRFDCVWGMFWESIRQKPGKV